MASAASWGAGEWLDMKAVGEGWGCVAGHEAGGITGEWLDLMLVSAASWGGGVARCEAASGGGGGRGGGKWPDTGGPSLRGPV